MEAVLEGFPAKRGTKDEPSRGSFLPASPGGQALSGKELALIAELQGACVLPGQEELHLRDTRLL